MWMYTTFQQKKRIMPRVWFIFYPKYVLGLASIFCLR